MDYYSILGVAKNASEQEIRKAYKKMSMKHHPDRGGDENEFKKVNEAYQILGNPEKRKQYDTPQASFRSADFRGQFDDLNPFFSQFFNDPRDFRTTRQVQKNKDIRLTYTISLEECFTGKEIKLQYQLPSGSVKEIDVNIPPGAKNGDTIKFDGLGDNSIRHMPKGNLLLNIKVDNKTSWRVDGYNLHGTIKIPVWDFITGTEYIIDLPNNKTLQLNIPKGTQTGTTFSIHGHGLPNIKTGRKGTVFIKVNGIVPNINNEEILKQIEQIKDKIGDITN
jgi:curved DNA-binding protein